MFIAALLDAFPQYEERVRDAFQSFDTTLRIDESSPCGDGVMQGRRFTVRRVVEGEAGGTPLHEHVDWRSLRARLQRSSLSAPVRARAAAIFALLAEAEGAVHGCEADEVQFHEVGAWDSIADIVGAAVLIEAVNAGRWTASPAPLGSGRIRTAHGVLPVPAPATVRLLEGMATIDDGIAGERVTPTGAAILRHLCPPASPDSSQDSPGAVRRLTAAGTGFGTRRLPGISNQLRVLCFEHANGAGAGHHRLLDVVEFEVDDQSGEELAAAIDRLRTEEAVLDVTQTPVFGKKGRMMVHVRILARHGQHAAVIDACFRETTTIGLRYHTVRALGLPRHAAEAVVDGRRLRVKVVERPDGRTAKTESDDVLEHASHARRSALRAQAERAVLAGAADENA